jgi:hypothetical protein
MEGNEIQGLGTGEKKLLLFRPIVAKHNLAVI